jgi:allantoinase
MAKWMAYQPADLLNVAWRKGSIASGNDADLVVFDPEASFVVEAAQLYHRHPITPYEGKTLFGRVDCTFLRGRPVFAAGKFLDPPRGRIIWAVTKDDA